MRNPLTKKIPVEKMVSNDSASTQYNCSACGGNHVMEECLIRSAILKQGFCDICEAEPGRHYEDCPLIELYDDQGVCFYCTRRDHSYSRCPFLVKREVVDEEKPKAVHAKDPPRKRESSSVAQGEGEARRQLHYHKEDDDAGHVKDAQEGALIFSYSRRDNCPVGRSEYKHTLEWPLIY